MDTWDNGQRRQFGRRGSAVDACGGGGLVDGQLAPVCGPGTEVGGRGAMIGSRGIERVMNLCTDDRRVVETSGAEFIVFFIN